MNVSKSSKCVAKLTDSLETLIQSAPSWQSFGRQGSDITPVFQPSACATDAKCPCPGTVWDQEGDWFWFDFLALFLFLEILGFSHPCGENHLTDCGIIENRDGNYWLHLHQHSHSSLPCLLCKYDVYSFIYVAPNIVHLSSRPFFFMTGSHEAHSCLRFAMPPRKMTLNSWFFCLHLLSSGLMSCCWVNS